MRTPSAGHARDPRGGYLYAVRYVDSRGETCTRTFWLSAAATRFAARVRTRGGDPRIHRHRIDRWEELT